MAWWTDVVFYEVYLRSVQDSDGDGVGDLRGLIGRLDHLADLGIGALWLTPFYPSPLVDFGYDIADHEAVDPAFGTLADFDRLVERGHRLGIRVVVDLVLNHTSDRHPWFEASRESKASPLRDWYIWRDGAGAGRPPSNWESIFGGPAWTVDERTGQWYYHAFYSAQPDLNWRNPEVEARMFETAAFWLDRGVAGFRLDAVNTLFEDIGLRDNPPLARPRRKLTGIETQTARYTRGLPEIHGVLRRLRAFVERRAPDAVLISEAYVESAAALGRFYGAGDEVQLPFNFLLAQVPGRDAMAFRDAFERVAAAAGDRWLSLVLSNHDIDRACDRYAHDGADPDAVAKVLAAMLLLLPATPFIYYGEEIAMRTEPPATIDEVRDPVGRRFWPDYPGRDGVRRPMPWSADPPGAGFSTGEPWLALPRDWRDRNVASQSAEPGSVFAWYRRVLALRRDDERVRRGGYEGVDAGQDVFAFRRTSGARALLVLLNMANGERPVALAGAPVGRVRASTHRPDGESITVRSLTMMPLEALVIEPSS